MSHFATPAFWYAYRHWIGHHSEYDQLLKE
jgi:hypothetical protein